ncbi:hypothetical protein TTHERM_00466130 (macronuclear) [Tetrahymena thermophila SB210]|uniref:Uncharacterized protein n=1 Tax=Tetrahymena thermophila (strain SB210) TaxID=312017 RepID=I7MAK4_TETTS|nr:hypothetical protein TTHERM_00466130 [Tetrahymena thermophila SB210]EAS04766.2 hypothetical protein TTHERM_00466130 [Tetrahymena thermophila SB210]|eukprot:XP_001025011.2 hypothetical protein TTHERM_00466130 [Tetrahymena thermophila SB210]
MDGEKINTSGISLDILEDILELAFQKWQKEKRYNPTSEFNSIKVLSSYNEILYQRNINSEKDQLYYNFIHQIGKQIPKGSSKDDWLSFCKQIFKSPVKSQYQKSEESAESNKNLSMYANKDYINKLMMKAFIVLLKNCLYKRQKKKDQFKKQQQESSSPIMNQDNFIAESDSFIKYKRNQVSQKNLQKQSSQSQIKNSPHISIDSHQNQNKSSNMMMSPPTQELSLLYKSSNNKMQREIQIDEQNKQVKQCSELNFIQKPKVKESHNDSIRQLTAKESLEYQNQSNRQIKSNNSFSQLNQVTSPSQLPLQTNNSPSTYNNLQMASPNKLPNFQKKQKNIYLLENTKGFQELETVATASNTDNLATMSSNTNTFRTKTIKFTKDNANTKYTKSLINCMYDNLDMIETNMDELGENAINMTRMSADFDASSICRVKNNTKFLDESYSFHQVNTANNLFQTGHEQSLDEMSFQQTDQSYNLPQNTTKESLFVKFIEKKCNEAQTPKILSKSTDRQLFDLDFCTIQENIKILSSYFIKLQIYKNQQKKKKQIQQQILNLEKEADSYFIRKLKDKVFCLLKAFGIVSSETQERYNKVKRNNEMKIKRQYLYKFVEKYHEKVLEKTQIEYLQKNISQNLIQKAFYSMKDYHEKQYQKRMAANSLIFTSTISVDFIINLYLSNILRQNESLQLQSIYQLFQDCSAHYNYKPLVTSLIKNALITQKNSKLLLRQNENIILNKKHTYFSVLKSLYERNFQASNLYNYKVMQKVFNVFKNYSCKRMQLKDGLEQFISKRLCNKLQEVIYSWKQFTVENSLLQRKGSIVFDKYRQKMTKKYISKWIENFNNQQEDKQKILKSNTFFFQTVCSKVLFEMKKNSLKKKSKRLMNQMAIKHSNDKTLRFFFDVVTVFYERSKIERIKLRQIEDKKNLINLKQYLNLWRLERFYNKITFQFRLNNVFQKLIFAFEQEKQISKEYEQKVQQFQKQQVQRKVQKAFAVLQQNTNLSSEYFRDAFSFHYNTLISKAFNILRVNREIKMQKYSNVFEYLNKKAHQLQFNIFETWKQRAIQNSESRKKDKLALNFYIKKLFTLIIKTLQDHAQQQKSKKQNKDLALIYYKNSLWKRWRQKFIDKIVINHDNMRLMTLGMKSMIINLNNKKQMNEKIQKADYFMYMSLFKKAQYFIEFLKINKEKAFFKKQAVNNAREIIEKNCKARIFQEMKKYSQKNKGYTKKIILMKQIKNLELTKIYFIKLMQNLANKKIFTRKIFDRLELQKKKNLKSAIRLWKKSIDIQNEEIEIHDKGAFLQQTLLKKRFFVSFIQHHQQIQADKIQNIKSIQFYKRQLFYKFRNIFYKSIELKKLKFIATKHFAFNLMRKGFFGWKQYSVELFEQRYKKVDEYFDNPFLMSQKKSTISLVDKENFDINQQIAEDFDNNFDSIMSYSSDKKLKPNFGQNQNKVLKVIDNYRK